MPDWISYIFTAEFAGVMFLSGSALCTLLRIIYGHFDELLDLRDKFRKRLRQGVDT
jgi:hypothetical protein